MMFSCNESILLRYINISLRKDFSLPSSNLREIAPSQRKFKFADIYVALIKLV